MISKITRSSAIAVIADRTACNMLTATSRPLNKKIRLLSIRRSKNYCGSASLIRSPQTAHLCLHLQSAARLLIAQALVRSRTERHRVIVYNEPTHSPRNAITVGSRALSFSGPLRRISITAARCVAWRAIVSDSYRIKAR